MPKIIILRGNSGSGKSTVADALQKKIGRGTLLLAQDVIRREILWVKDRPGNQAVDLLKTLVQYGAQNCAVVILEGILQADVYDDLFTLAQSLFPGQTFAYYFDMPFEETLRRHEQRTQSHEFGEEEMHRWWREKDYVPYLHEKTIDKDVSLDEIVATICDAIAN